MSDRAGRTPAFGLQRPTGMSMYAIISLGGKQYRVQQGQRLLVDRLPYEESKAFHPPVLFVGGDGKVELAPKSVQVTAKVVDNVLGDKIRIGKYRKRTGYRRHAGHRSRLSQVEITAIGAKAAARPRAAKAEDELAEEKQKPTAPAKPRAAAQRKAPARKAPATKEAE
jgi:large subunit ribosomal protein L21